MNLSGLVLLGVLAIGCGEVAKAPGGALGKSCATGDECASGTCSDGVCCDRACDAECEACVVAKTGGEPGVCAPVIAGADPDAECSDDGAATCGSNHTGCNGSSAAPGCKVYPMGTACGTTCTATGTVDSECDGAGACVAGAPTSCGYYACNAAGSACGTTCTQATSSADCSPTGYCNVTGVCAKRLRIGLEAAVGACGRDAFPAVQAALEARGHTVTVVAGGDIDTAVKLAGFDVIALGGFGGCVSSRDDQLFDTAILPWVQGGGGVVATGWHLFNTPQPNMLSLLPNSGNGYLSGPQTLSITGTHPITAGFSGFTAQGTYVPYGGSPRAGSVTLFTETGGNSAGQAWDFQSGRSVYLGPVYFDSFSAYQNADLTNGMNSRSLEILIRSIEWSGKAL